MLSSTSPVPPDPSSAPFFSEEDSKSLPAALKNVAISRFEVFVPTEDGRTVGRVWFHNGSVYTGELLNEMMHGNGVYQWPDLSIYSGQFTHNHVTGVGTFKWPNGWTYEGQVVDGFREGTGRIYVSYSPQADKHVNISYEGQWVKGKRQGQVESCKIKLAHHAKGIWKYSVQGPAAEEQTWTYTGSWKDGKKNGSGRMTYPSGAMYDGEWKNGMKCGRGTMTWKSHEVYVGDWVDGAQHGDGAHYYSYDTEQWGTEGLQASGETPQFMRRNFYMGQWQHGKRHGNGSFFYADGSKYVGEWSKNIKEGEGVFTFEDSRSFACNFKSDKMANFGGSIQGDRNQQAIVDLKGWMMKDIAALYPVPVLKTDLQNLMLRHISDFRRMYKHYSNMGRTVKGDTYIMTNFQFTKLLRDANLLSPLFTAAAANRVVARQFLKAKGQSNAIYQSPHNPNNPLLLQEFVEAMMRVALSSHAATRTKRVISLLPIKTDTPTVGQELNSLFSAIVGRQQKSTSESSEQAAASSPSTELSMDSGDASIWVPFKEVEGNLLALCERFKRRPKQDILPVNNDRTMSTRGFLQMCKDLNILDSTLDTQRVTQLFIDSVTGEFDVEQELTYCDVVEGIGKCAFIKSPELQKDQAIRLFLSRLAKS